MYKVLAAVSSFIVALISYAGYLGVIVAMAIESACIPLPSEVIMPFSGYLVSRGRFDLWWVSLAGALGCSIGSAIAYGFGLWGGRPLVLKYGRYLLMDRGSLEKAERFFQRYGDKATFLARLLPVIRTFISLPAGIGRMPFGKFLFYSFAGSVPWCLFLTWIGFKLGERWEEVREVFHRLDLVIGLAILSGLFWLIGRLWQQRRGTAPERKEGPPW